MATQSVNEERGEGTEKATSREQRGLRLYRERGDEIEHVSGSAWIVPGTSSRHKLNLDSESCKCKDSQYRGGLCLHIYAATIANAKSALCDGCGKRFPKGELTEVTEDHESLTWFEHDLICQRCAIETGVL